MKPRLILFFLLLLPFAKPSYAQVKADSLKAIWEDENLVDSLRYKAIYSNYNLYTYSQPDKALETNTYHYTLAKTKSAQKEMARALNHKAIIYAVKGNLEKALALYNDALKIATKINDPTLRSTIQGNIGNIYSRRKDFQKATQQYTAALKVFQSQNNQKGEARMLNNLGGIYQVIGNYDLALEYYDKSLSIFENNEVQGRKIGLLFLNFGSIYLVQEKYSEAIVSFQKSLVIFQEQKETILEAVCYNYLAKVYKNSGQTDRAFFYAKKGLALGRKIEDIKDEWEIITSRLIIAQLTFETDTDKATQLAEKITNELPEEVDKKLKKDIYELLYKCYKAQNKMGSSLKMFELKTIYEDSITKEQNNFAVVRETVKNDFDVQLYENKLADEKAQAALKLKQLKTTISIVLGAIVLISFILFFFRFKMKKNKKKRDSLIEELEHLKKNNGSEIIINTKTFELNRKNIESSINRKLNNTDWDVLNILLEQPEITNKDIAKKAFKSVDGIGSSLRRMYDYFDIKETRYKKIALLKETINRCNGF